MSNPMRTPALDPARVRELFDLRGAQLAATGGHYVEDPYPIWHRLREEGPVLPGTLHELTGLAGPLSFHGLNEPERPHFTAFSFDACNEVYRRPEIFASSPNPTTLDATQVGTDVSMFAMGGARHRRYRGLVQPSFVPAQVQWWISNFIDDTVHSLIDSFADVGRAELNVDFCAPIPIATITGSFGVPIERALDIRAALRDPAEIARIVSPVVAARRDQPADDLISVLVQAEFTDEDGTVHRLSDAEIHTFSLLLLAAGPGTTWKQMSIVLATLLQRPELLEAVRADRTLLRSVVEENIRWMPTDPMFSRWVTQDTDLFGTALPEGAVVHLNLGAANRDPARWERPDEFDPHRPLKGTLAFGGGPHICLGMHVARAEIMTGVNALLDRLPNLRLDPEQAPPQVIGFYERGATDIPVLFDR